MSDSPAPYPVDNAQRDASVRRIGLPIGVASAVIGVISLVMLITRLVSAYQPPALIAVNLSFCAMMMGVGILFYIRHTPRMRIALVSSIIAMATGLAGPVLFAKLSIDYRSAEQNQELANLTAIAAAAKTYAQSHDGNYPPDLATLVEQKLIPESALHSPYERMAIAPTTLPTDHGALQKYLDDHTDYQYFGQGLRLQSAPSAHPDEDLFPHILLASRRDPIERRDLSVGFTDGRADMIGLEEAEQILKTSNDARKSFGFAAVSPPSSVERAEAERKADQQAGR